MITANSTTLAKLAPLSTQNSTKLFRMPSANAAITAPRSWPSPPATTTRNASTM